MKVLVFHIGPDRYGLALKAITRVLPVVGLKQIPLAPAFVAGLMDLHGEPVPVIDLSTLAGFPPRAVRFDTRIVLADYLLPGGAQAAIGLLAEQVSGVETVDLASLREAGVSSAPFLGRVASSQAGMLQLVDIGHLLTDEVRTLLFQPQGAP